MSDFKVINLIVVFMLSVGFVSCVEEPETYDTTQVGKVGEAVDLGLPSGKLWSSWNIGASSVYEYGNYYAWGEISGKTNYSLSTYQHYDQEWQEYKDIGNSIAETKYDVASVLWGDGWHIPTVEDFSELIDNCTWTWIQFDNFAWGYKVEGKNGNKIFLPAIGMYKGKKLQDAEKSGYYWSESLYGDENQASILCVNNEFNKGHISVMSLYNGLAIRPVKGGKKISQEDEPNEEENPSEGEGSNEGGNSNNGEETNTPSNENFDIFSTLKKDEMFFVEGGTFTMGATSGQGTSDPDDDEYPTHQVTLSDFYIGKYEVTQQLWEYVMKYSGTCADGSTMSAYASYVWLSSKPSSTYGVGNYYPAYFVSWGDIVDNFIPRLNKITGKTFRLPTEAEWEYAARGGNKSLGYKYSGSNSIGDVAWYSRNSLKTQEVGTKAPNELGLYDMSGNVWEWCSDWYDENYYSSSPSINPTGPGLGSYRVARGGSWDNGARNCRVSDRLNYYSSHGSNSSPETRGSNLGFRLVCDR